MSSSETKNVSGISDAIANTQTWETTIKNDDGSKTSARGVSPEQSQEKASDANDKKR